MRALAMKTELQEINVEKLSRVSGGAGKPPPPPTRPQQQPQTLSRPTLQPRPAPSVQPRPAPSVQRSAPAPRSAPPQQRAVPQARPASVQRAATQARPSVQRSAPQVRAPARNGAQKAPGAPRTATNAARAPARNGAQKAAGAPRTATNAARAPATNGAQNGRGGSQAGKSTTGQHRHHPHINIKSAFKHVGHALHSVEKKVVHGGTRAAQSIGKDVKNAAKAVGAVGKGLVHDIKHHESVRTTFKDLGKNTVKAGKAIVKAQGSVIKAATLNPANPAAFALNHTKAGKAIKNEAIRQIKSEFKDFASPVTGLVSDIKNHRSAGQTLKHLGGNIGKSALVAAEVGGSLVARPEVGAGLKAAKGGGTAARTRLPAAKSEQ